MEAYNDRIDCFRSGLDEVGFEAALDGLPELDEGGPPKKSRPSNDSPCLGCFGGAASGPVLVGLRSGISAVFGLIGGAIGLSSPNRSTLAAGAATGAARRTLDTPGC